MKPLIIIGQKAMARAVAEAEKIGSFIVIQWRDLNRFDLARILDAAPPT